MMIQAGMPWLCDVCKSVFGVASRRKISTQLREKLARSRGQREYPLLHVTHLMLPPLRARIGLLSCGWAVIFLTVVAAQTLRSQTPEYPIGGALPGDQDYPAIGIGANGGFLVWDDNRTDGKHGRGIAAVALNSDLVSTGSVFKVNQQSSGDQGRPQVQLLGNGNTLFVWEVRRSSKPGVYARVLAPNGSFLSGDLPVSQPSWTTTAKRSSILSGVFRGVPKERKFGFREKFVHIREQSGHVSVGALPDGGAVVVYHSIRKTETNTYELTNSVSVGVRNDLLKPVRRYGDSMHDIYFQRLDGTGRKLGTEVQVNQYSAFSQRSPAMSVLTGGKFVVVWVCEFSNGSNSLAAPIIDGANIRIDLRARLFDAQGQPLGDEFPIATGDDVVPANPSVAARPDGGFTVFWSQQEDGRARRWDVYGGVFGHDGAANGGSFQVNAYTDGDQFAPRAASIGDTQLVVWTSRGQDGSREGIYGRLLRAGTLSGEEFRVNETTISRQINPAVAGDGQGRFLSVWSSFVGETAGVETGMDLLGSILPVIDETATAGNP